ncbi:hypothetical protein KXV85_005017 [Aspergillus fumigatus]|nr:hypothetical protein KXV85_005017 [Aspergillus fumigatus]KAH2892947.1 hypothetical protein KXV75_003059 [Aspergillus fumigatus]
MARSNYLRIFRVLEEINRRRTIPDIYHEALEDRLVITFTQPSGPLKRSKTRRPKKEYKLQYENTKAHRVYVEILEDYPQLFIPFILATPPKSCETFKLGGFREKHDLSAVKVDLRPDIRRTLDNIANRKGFNQNRRYRRLICTLFPSGRKPATTAETQNCWAYRAAYLNAVHTIFSEQICSAMEVSPTAHSPECQAPQTTSCVEMKLPKQNYQDAIVLLELSLPIDTIKILFPSANERIICSLSPQSGRGPEPSTQIAEPGRHDSQSEQSTISQSEGYILRGASISAILSVFGPRIWGAIEKSQLRKWEKDNLSEETTDCVSIEIHPRRPHCSTCRVRIGFIDGTYIANRLYAHNRLHNPTYA